MKTKEDEMRIKKSNLVRKYYLTQSIWEKRSYLELLSFTKWVSNNQITIKERQEKEKLSEGQRAVFEDCEFGKTFEKENAEQIKGEILIFAGFAFLVGCLIMGIFIMIN